MEVSLQWRLRSLELSVLLEEESAPCTTTEGAPALSNRATFSADRLFALALPAPPSLLALLLTPSPNILFSWITSPMLVYWYDPLAASAPGDGVLALISVGFMSSSDRGLWPWWLRELRMLWMLWKLCTLRLSSSSSRVDLKARTTRSWRETEQSIKPAVEERTEWRPREAEGLGGNIATIGGFSDIGPSEFLKSGTHQN